MKNSFHTEELKIELIDNIHAKFKSYSSNDIYNLERLIIDTIKTDCGEKIEKLEDIHMFYSPKTINNLRLKAFNAINADGIDWKKILENIASTVIHSRIGPDYVIQQKANLSIQMPNDHTSILPIHSDCVSGDSPWQQNIWIPLTRAHNTAAMFIVNKIDSLEYLKNLSVESKDMTTKNERLDRQLNSLNRDYINCEKGEVIMFCPGVLHGNTVNKEAFTRVSINIRVKSIYAPNSRHGNSDREFGTYYKAGFISNAGKLAIDIDKAMETGNE